MKRSSMVRLVAMSSAVITLAGCNPTAEQTPVFSSVEDCVQKGGYDPDVCRQQFSAAADAYRSNAPHFNSREACVEKHGADACQNVQTSEAGGGSFWMPMMTGFMLGQALNGGRFFGAPQPVYQGAPADRSAAASRGGFGSSARSYSSFGAGG